MYDFQSRARQLFNAGYKTIRSIAAAKAEELVESIEHLPRRVANQMIAAAKVGQIIVLLQGAQCLFANLYTNPTLNVKSNLKCHLDAYSCRAFKQTSLKFYFEVGQ